MPSIYLPGGAPLSWADARAKVRGDLWKPGSAIPDDVIDRALHAALLELEAESRWLWLENITDGLTFGANADNIPLPATVQSISALSYRQGLNLEPLAPAPLSTVRELAASSPGRPTMYARTAGTLFFDTICPAGLIIEMVFTATTPPELNDAVASANYTLSLQQNAVIPLACSDVARSYLKNSEEADRQWQIYDRRLVKLLEKESQQRADEGQGGVVPDIDYARAAYGWGG